MFLKTLARFAVGAFAAAVLAFTPNAATAQSGNPITIGFAMSLTGPLAANGKQALLGMQIWEEEINAKGGLLGRPVKLVYYDDQTNPSTIPGIYTKLLDVDKVDLVVGPYATNMAAPAMPVVMQKGKVFIILFGLAVNTEFKYPKFFAMIPSGPDPKPSFTLGFFETAAAQNPKPTTVALVAADAEFANNACEGARTNAAKFGFRVVYDRRYPPATTDFAPIVRAIQAANPDIVAICSYPLDSVGMVRAVNELNYKPKMIGGAMVGLQATVFKNQLGPLLNGWVNYETWVPAKNMMFEGTDDVLQEVPVEGTGRRRRSARLLPRRLGPRLHLGARRRHQGDQQPRRQQARRTYRQDRIQDHSRQHQVRCGRRVGQVGHAAGAVSRHQAGRRPRNLARHGLPDRADAE